VTASLREKAAGRAKNYKQSIAEKQQAGDYKGALHEAHRWLLGELGKVARQRPHDAPQVYADVTDRLAALAEHVPFYKPRRS